MSLTYLAIVEKILACKSFVFEAIAVETRRDANVEERDEEIYVVVCDGIGIANLLGERCYMKYIP